MLEEDIKIETTDKAAELAERAELTSLRNQIAALTNQNTELRKEKNILGVEFYFALP